MLLVCSAQKLAEQLTRIISSVFPAVSAVASSGSQAKRLTSITDYSIVIIAGKLSDQSAPALAYELSDNQVKPIIIIVDSTECVDAHELLNGLDVTVLTKPLSKEAFINTLRLVSKIQSGEGGIFEKAKLGLVQQKGWTEQQAHRYIQKVSMEKRLPRDVTSQYVLKALAREATQTNN